MTLEQKELEAFERLNLLIMYLTYNQDDIENLVNMYWLIEKEYFDTDD